MTHPEPPAGGDAARAAPDADAPDVDDQAVADDELRMTPGEWHALVEGRSFLERADNRSASPRLFHGRPVRIVPDESFR